MRKLATRLSVLAALALASRAGAAPGDEVEVTAGVVTGLRCALEARDGGNLRKLNSCPPAEAAKGLVVFDVAERRVYALARKKVRADQVLVRAHQLESAFGGGSIDFVGREAKADARTRVVTVEVSEFSIARKPKPGAFKGCL
jgi:hypothetical protein